MQLKPSRRNDLKEKYMLGARWNEKRKLHRRKAEIQRGQQAI